MKHTLIILALITATIQTFAQSPRIKLNQITKDSVTGSVLISSPTDSGMVYSRDLFISYGADTFLILGGDTLAATSSIISSVLSDGVTITGDGTSGSELTVDTATVIATKGDLNNIDLATQVTGTLPIANGGTGATSFTAGRMLKGNGTDSILAASNLSEDADTVFISDRLDIYNPNLTPQLTLSGPRSRFFMVNENGAGNYSQLLFGESTNNYAEMAWFNDDNLYQIFSFGDIKFSTQYVAPNVIPNLWIDVDDGYVGMGVSNPTHPLEMGSGAHVTTGGTWTNASDVKLKNNINYIYPYGLSEIMNLKPVVFDYINGEKNTLGFIAQDVYEFIPESISSTLDKYGNETMGLKMVSITATLTKAIQEQQAIIESQATEIEQLKSQIQLILTEIEQIKNN